MDGSTFFVCFCFTPPSREQKLRPTRIREKRMRKIFFLLLVTCSILLAACSDLAGYKKTQNGIYYHFEQQNLAAQPVQYGDILVGTVTIRLDDFVIRDNAGYIKDILYAEPWYQGELDEILMMMHQDDHLICAMKADSIRRLSFYLPQTYKPGKRMKIYFDINLQNIVTKEQLAREAAERALAEQLERERRERESQINGMWRLERIDYSTYDIIQETLTFQGSQYKYEAKTSGGRGWGGQWTDYTRRGNEIYVDGEELFTIEPNGDLRRKSGGDVFSKMY